MIAITRSGLALTAGQPYFVQVQAQNATGLWSQAGVSSPFVAGVVTTPTPTATATLAPGAPTATPTPTATATLLPGAPTATPMAPNGESETYLPVITR